MGRDQRQLTVIASVSNHHSEQDSIDKALWHDFYDRVKAIADEPKYQDIYLMVC